jgi:hypothetical protein
MNSPFPCSSKFAHGPCDGLATYVYRSATSTALVCDACAAQYRHDSSKMAVARNPTVPVALLELLPAREALVMNLEKLQSRHEAIQAHHEASLDIAADEKRLIDWVVLWANVMGVVLGAGTGMFLGMGWAFVAACTASLGCYLSGRVVVEKYWIAPQWAELNRKYPGVQ